MAGVVVITGLGQVTPLGNSVEETWRALLAGEFIRDHARVNLSEPKGDTGFQSVPAALPSQQGVIDAAQDMAWAESPCHDGTHSVNSSRIQRIALRAALEAIAHAGWRPDILSAPDTALVVGTSKGSVESWLSTLTGRIGDQPYVVGESLSFGLSDLAASLARHIGHGIGPRSTLTAACASGIHALIQAVLMLQSGVVRRAIVVAAESSVHPLFIASFKRLGVLPAKGIGCRPFDVERDGFLVSEAAAAVCLELEETSQAIATVDRYAMGGDATHLTGGDPDGRTLRHLLKMVIDDKPVDLVQAHATGTKSNDAVELAAIESCFPNRSPYASIYSHKGALGHSLGAAGLISVVLNCLSHRTGIIPPNVQTRHPIATRNTTISLETVQRPVRRSIAVAAGFGGAIGAVALRSPG